jgi:hypothetical protein
MAGQVNGVALGSVAVGGILVWSGIRNASVTTSLRSLVTGTAPAANTGGNPIVGTTTVSNPLGTTGAGSIASPALGGTNAQNQALGQQMAAAYGWSTGAQWTALNNIVMAESGWNDNAANPTSNARGIAQNINGWSSSYQQGNARQQIAWLLTYIKSRYGTPVMAWSFHLANGWY